MTLEDLIATILEKGTDTTFGELVGSEEFCDRLSDRRNLYELLATSNSDLAVALRAGHIEMGELLHNMPEYLALQQATQTNHPDPFLYELLDEVGEALVMAAEECLPAPIWQVAEHFGVLSADEQIKWIELVFDGFWHAHELSRRVAKKDKTGKKVLWTMDTDTLGEIDLTQDHIDEVIEYYKKSEHPEYVEVILRAIQWFPSDEFEDPPGFFEDGVNLIADYFDSEHKNLFEWLPSVIELEYPLERVLPACYGVYGESGVTPTCLGMSIMLVAFARMTGLNTMLVNPIEATDDLYKEFRGLDATAKLEHLDETGMSSSEATKYRATLENTLQESVDYQNRVYDFHYSVAIQVSDGRWVHLDPYMRHFGVFDESWELQRIFEILEKYQLVLPGLTLISDDRNGLRRYLADYLEKIKAAIAKTERVLRVLLEKPYPPEVVVDMSDDKFAWLDFDDQADLRWNAETLVALVDSEDLFLDYVTVFSREVTPSEAIWLLSDFLHDHLLGNPRIEDTPDDEDYIARYTSYLDMYLCDEEFKQQRIEYLLMQFLRIEIKRWNALVKEIEQSLLDPVMHFAIPEYNLALAVLSHVRCWTDSNISGNLLLSLSSSQIYWHEAVNLFDGIEQSGADDEEVLVAERMLRTLPHLHRACANKLEYLETQRKER